MGQCVGASYKWIDSCTMASLRQWVWVSISCGQSSGPRLKSIQTHGQWGMTWLGWSGTFGEKDWKIKGKEVWEGAVDGVPMKCENACVMLSLSKQHPPQKRD